MQTRLWWCLWCGLAESAFGGSLELDDWFCVGAFDSHHEDVLIHWLLLTVHFPVSIPPVFSHLSIIGCKIV
jgi:hypothetical protein